MQESDKAEVQSLVFRNYDEQAHSLFLLFRVRPGRAAAARGALAKLAKLVSFGSTEPAEPLNISFTFSGLEALELPNALLAGFPAEFSQGMHNLDRARALGDVEEAHPMHWIWGGPERPVHALVQLYAKSTATLAEAEHRLASLLSDAFEVVRPRPGKKLTEKREHFGFQDGLSQPDHVDFTPELNESSDRPNAIAWGELVLGQPNAYGDVIVDPALPERAPRASELPNGSFGRNGTYLVAREIWQDVHKFWSFLNEQSKRPTGEIDLEARERLAEKMVGRKRDGTPLLPPIDPRKQESFDYSTDKRGLCCPLGAHVRRANPRAALDPNPTTSVITVRAHRILRRGRSFGAPNFEAKTSEAGAVERGLTFVCLNANIRRQFEFVQQMWINNTKFGDGYDERDPLVGFPSTGFTIQQQPVRQKVKGIPAFTLMRGGGYFFLPSRRALKFLASEHER